MKNLLAVIIYLFFLCSAECSEAGENTRGIFSNTDDSPEHITLTFGDQSADDVSVSWTTSQKISNGFIVYNTAGTQELRKEASFSDFSCGSRKFRKFTVTLDNLSTKSKYDYAVGSEGNLSEQLSFVMNRPDSNFSFLLFGDSQSRTLSVSYFDWGKTVQNAFYSFQECSFMAITGDLVGFGHSSTHWNAWFEAASGVTGSIPVVPSVGNHETIASPSGGKPAGFTDMFCLPQNGPAGLKSQVYSFDYGCAHFSILDSQDAEESGDIASPQKKWLEEDLKKTKAVWKIVLFHKSPYPLKDRGEENEAVKESFCPIIDRYHADIVFNGHDHGIARSKIIKNDRYVQKPSQGTVYYITGRSGEKVYTDIRQMEWHDFFFNPLDQPCYSVVDVTSDVLTVKSFNTDGTAIYSFSIDKKTDSVR